MKGIDVSYQYGGYNTYSLAELDSNKQYFIEEVDNMKVITVCGSLKFYKEMMVAAEKMELQGNCMLVQIFNPSRPHKDDFTEEEALMLDQMHKEKIKISDAIFVVNVDGYIGNSTSKEIEYAKQLGKEIIYYTDLK